MKDMTSIKEALLNDVDYQTDNGICIQTTENFAADLINPNETNDSIAAGIAKWANGSGITFTRDYIRAGIYYWDAKESDELSDLITDDEARDYAEYIKENK